MVHAHGHSHGFRHRKRSLEDWFDWLKPNNGDDDDKGGKDQTAHIVYVTRPATFDGDVGGYVTGTKPDEAPTAGVGPAFRPTGKPSQDTTETTEPHTKAPQTHTTNEAPKKTDHTVPTKIITDPSPLSTTTLATAIASTTTASDLSMTSLPDPTAATTADSASDKSSDSSPTTTAVPSETGLSGGAKAGIAIGVILGVGLIAGLIFFWLRKKKQNQNRGVGDNEKTFHNHGVVPSPGPPPMSEPPMTPVNPPQLNIRPVTQFAPDFSGGDSNALAAGAVGAAAGSAAASRNLTPHQPANASQPPNTSGSNGNPFSDPVNPFGSQAETHSPPGAPSAISQSAVPGTENAGAPAPDDAPSASAVPAAAAGTAVAGAVAAGVAFKAAEKDLPSRPETPGSRSQSPAGSPDAAAAPAPMVAGAVPAAPGPMNVHRVQMDFAPSMEDELELRAGQLVRLMHEYDDGWTLCVRLDRSQQGVAPRTCLSARPVKPRPRGPPNGPPRGPPIMGPNGRPMSPAGRPMSPAGGRMPPGPMKQPRFYPGGAPMSPARPGMNGPPQPPYPQRPISPASFPAVPPSLSAGPGRQIPPRSMSPGPYGPPGMRKPNIPPTQRSRSNSAGALGQSPLAGGASPPSSLPSTPAPSGKLPDLPTSPPEEAKRKPVSSSST